MTERDNPGVVTYPPLLMFAAIFLGIAMDNAIPVSVLPPAWGFAALIGGAFFVLAGLSIGLWAVLAFGHAGTNVDPHKPTLALVRHGPYRFTRNPMYIGLMLLEIGISIAASVDWGIPMVIPLWLALHHGVVLREEAYLIAKFGAPYEDFLARTRRWI